MTYHDMSHLSKESELDVDALRERLRKMSVVGYFGRERKKSLGNPDPKHIPTSFAER
jgi:hypothetical protein